MITSVAEISSRQLGLDQRFLRTYRRVFRVRTDDPREPHRNVIFASANGVSIPRMYDCYWTGTPSALEEVDTGAFVTDVLPEQDDEDPYLWLVEVTYKSLSGDPADFGAALGSPGQTGGDSGSSGGELTSPENPLARPYKVSWKSNHYERSTRVDIVGMPTLNTAGEPYDPPLTRRISHAVLHVERNVATWTRAQQLRWQDACNSEEFLGASPGFAQVVAIQADRQFEDGLAFFALSFDVEFAEPGNPRGSFRPTWVLQEGFRELINGQLVDVRVKQGGELVAKAVMLNEDGGRLAEGEDPVFAEHFLYKEDNLNELLA